MTGAIGLVPRVAGRIVAEHLGAKRGILRRNHGEDGVVDGEDDQRQHYSSNQESLRKGPTLLDLKDANPQEPNANSCDTADGTAEQEQDEEGHKNVVDRESLGRLDENPVDRLENVDMSKNISAV